MATTDIDLATDSKSFRRSPVFASPAMLIAVTVACVVALNLLIYAVGRICGGAFTYVQAGRRTTVDIAAVTVMSAGPLAIGLTLVMWLSRRWPALTVAAKVGACVLAVVTIAVMTIPAGFDTTSTLFLAAMHLVPAAATLLALDALDRYAGSSAYG